MLLSSPKSTDDNSREMKSYSKPKLLNFFLFLIFFLLIIPHPFFAGKQQDTSSYSHPFEGARFGAGGVVFVRSVDLDGAGSREIVVGMKGVIARDVDFPDGLGPEWLVAPGEVYIYERLEGLQGGSDYRKVFRARNTLSQETGKEVYSPLLLKGAKDIDRDGLPELVINWAGDGWGPTDSPYTLTVLQFNPSRDSYDLTFDPSFKANVRDGFALKDVDGDRAIEVIKFDPNPTEITCHYCEYPYRITVYEFTGEESSTIKDLVEAVSKEFEKKVGRNLGEKNFALTSSKAGTRLNIYSNPILWGLTWPGAAGSPFPSVPSRPRSTQV